MVVGRVVARVGTAECIGHELVAPPIPGGVDVAVLVLLAQHARGSGHCGALAGRYRRGRGRGRGRVAVCNTWYVAVKARGGSPVVGDPPAVGQLVPCGVAANVCPALDLACDRDRSPVGKRPHDRVAGARSRPSGQWRRCCVKPAYGS